MRWPHRGLGLLVDQIAGEDPATTLPLVVIVAEVERENEMQRLSDGPDSTSYVEYGFTTSDDLSATPHLLPHLFDLAGELSSTTRVLDVGCGNGAILRRFGDRGCVCVGIDLSAAGIAIAKAAYPAARFEVIPASENLLGRLGEAPFDLVISTELVEHLYAPGPFATGCYNALRPGGRLIISTPYHGYFKNIAVAATGKFDFHAHPLRQGGHIKFWSRATLTQLLSDAGFADFEFRGAGRLPLLWRSMVMSAGRPTA